MYQRLKLERNDQNVKNANYTADVTLANSFSDSIVQYSFGMADCGKMRGGGSGRYNLFKPILLLLL